MALRGAMTGGNTGATTTTDTATLTFPAGTVAGDVGVVVTSQNVNTATANTPAGWTLLAGPTDQSTNMRTYLFGKVLTAADVAAGSVTVTMSAPQRWVAIGTVRKDVTGFGVVSVIPSSGAATNVTTPTITTTADGADVISTVAYRRASTPLGGATWPAGWTEVVEGASGLTSGANAGVSLAELDAVGPIGSYGGATVTLGQSEVSVGYTVSMPPASAPSHSGTASLTGSGVLGLAAAVAVSGALVLGGSGSLAATGRVSASGSVNLTGAGSLATAGGAAFTGSAGLSGAGSLTGTGTAQATGALPRTATGTLAATGTGATAAGSLALAGSGFLAVAGSASSDGAGGVTLTAAGTLTATGKPAHTGALTRAATGTLGVAGRPATTASLELTGGGNLDATGLPQLPGNLELAGTGTLTAADAANLRDIDVTADLASDRYTLALTQNRSLATLTGDRYRMELHQ